MDGYKLHCFKAGKGIAVRGRIKGIIYFNYEILSSSLCFCSPSLLDVGSFCMDPVWTLHQHCHHIVCSMALSWCFLRVSRNSQGWYDAIINQPLRRKQWRPFSITSASAVTTELGMQSMRKLTSSLLPDLLKWMSMMLAWSLDIGSSASTHLETMTLSGPWSQLTCMIK